MALDHWTGWMVQFMSDTLRAGNGGPQLGRGPCTAEERALGEVRAPRAASSSHCGAAAARRARARAHRRCRVSAHTRLHTLPAARRCSRSRVALRFRLPPRGHGGAAPALPRPRTTRAARASRPPAPRLPVAARTQALATTWRGWGYAVAFESFACAPHAFLGAIPLTAFAYARALRLYHARPAAALASIAVGVFVFVAEVVTYHELLDGLGLFPLKTGAPRLAAACVCGRVLRRRGVACARISSSTPYRLA